jgi:hypothetical protein
VAKYQANKAAAPVSVTVTERTNPGAQGTSKEYRKIEALSIASEHTPEPAKPRSAVAPGDEIMRVFTVQVMELNRRTAKRPPERFSASAVPVEVLARLGNFLTHLANLKNNAAKIDAGHRRTQQRCDLGWAFGRRYGCKMLRWMFRFRRASRPRRGCSPAGAR